MTDRKQEKADLELESFFEESDEQEDSETDSDETDDNAANADSNDTKQQNDSLSQSTREIQRQKQVKAWVRNIQEGEKDLSELPKDKQWLKPFIEEEMKKHDIDFLVEQKLKAELEKRDKQLNAEREKKKTAKLLEEARNLGLDELEKAEMSHKVEQLKVNGLSSVAAFQEGLEYIKLIRDSSESKREQLRAKMSIPAIRSKGGEKEKLSYTDSDFHKKGDSKTRVQVMENALNNQ